MSIVNRGGRQLGPGRRPHIIFHYNQHFFDRTPDYPLRPPFRPARPHPRLYVFYNAGQHATVRADKCCCSLSGRTDTNYCSWCYKICCEAHSAFSFVPGTFDVCLVSCNKCLAIPTLPLAEDTYQPVVVCGPMYVTSYLARNQLPTQITENLRRLHEWDTFQYSNKLAPIPEEDEDPGADAWIAAVLS